LDLVWSLPDAEPARLSLEYINECTNNFTSKILGEGAFGAVYLGTDRQTGREFAVKRVPLQLPTKAALDQISLSFKREIAVSKCAELYEECDPADQQRILSFFIVLFHALLCVPPDSQAVSSPEHCSFVRL
jgi:hypothetical protein